MVKHFWQCCTLLNFFNDQQKENNMKRNLIFTVLCFSVFSSESWAAPLPTLAPEEKATRDVSADGTDMPTDPKLYASAIGEAHFERSALRTQQGYTVESGSLLNEAKNEIGSMVLVRSPDGSVTAFINEPNKRGLLEIDPNGQSKFTADEPYDSMTPDTVNENENENETESPASSGPSAPTEGDTPKALSYSDVLVAYGNAVYNQVSDPIAFAMGQVETANAALRKTGDNAIALRLAAITVFHNNTSASSAGLDSWQDYLQPYRSMFKTDLNVVFTGKSGSIIGGYIYGIAKYKGFTSANAPLSVSTVFRHEVAHNAGAKHCGEVSDHAQGYKGSRPAMNDFYSILCGDEFQNVYSNPNYKNFYGVAMGSATKGDTARVWRENTDRLVNYNTGRSGMNLMLVGTRLAELQVNVPSGLAPYVVAESPENGPTRLITAPDGDFTRLTARVIAEGSNQEYTVRLRGTRANGNCAYVQIHYAHYCASGPNLYLRISFFDADNPDLPRDKHYTGFLPLIFVEPKGTVPRVPINVSIAVWR